MDQNNKIFVGNLSWELRDDKLREVFSQFGEITDAVVIIDRRTNRSKGFGFVTFATPEAAQAAIEAMDGQDVDGRNIVVNIARPREERPPREFNN
ncbi:MAG: RNA-binding protein [Candidatus Roizmanbacteria bacterium]|uniref:RNA-binding protein n=1 Tax=Candidatus Roizmanbacteria bacterium CG_4_9_14_0_2_um_filter_39_13 TaxID=1974839 RepID=A0A2M8EZY3_9BACT|nr:RNA-binding protein [Candidatus Roizmanbacteria bacterium]PJC32602.1 MAG: RNA-binding protein [Candidatus Roizmanbacteria bacterium CG_4_9_14_0_2_um_filter_39_13]